MPELPEVEFARRSLVKWTDGRRIVRTEADPKARTFRNSRVPDVEALTGRLVRAERRGKFLMLTFDDGRGAVAHLGMTGKFVKRSPGTETKWSRARFVLDSGEVIHFQDPRLFGLIEPVPATELTTHESVAKLGVDPLVDGLTVEQLREALAGSKQELKVALMDQERIAGLGNIHAAEALFRAKVHPSRKPDTLSPAELTALTKAIHEGISFALEVEDGEEIEYVEEPGAKNPFLVYGRAGEPCSRCRTPIEQMPQGGRTTFFCPKCQKAPEKARAAPTKRPAPKARSKTPAARGRKRA
ncbi:MAG: bifunctional DNA-formamidopyrimidine glycosylase/DNA-(apurinic or apyrimidinic site) lyase [Myxococcaceae bacterium]|jgi:formamidopyrimidine-DNA glycosylase|nr:bifunctional DNA-formamidopyrimidine glycosylase/DNA-(apurinic or apyrimidinic site) lyase [Myxococcaceae bacterium]